MLGRIKTFLSTYLNPTHKFTLITVTFIVKLIFFGLYFPAEIVTPGMLGIPGGDTESYFLPIENLLNGGGYIPDYRLPGYGLIYLALRLLFSKIIVYNALIVLQWIVSTLSIYYLAKSVWLVAKRTSLFHITFFLHLFSTSTNVLDYYLLTESFTTSSLIFSIYFLIQHLQKGGNKFLLISGSMICWGIFMRPVLLPILGIYSVIIIWHLYTQRVRPSVILYSIFLMGLPFLIIDTAWIIRNYIQHNRIVPLTTTQYPLDLELTYYNELMGFVIAWGGDRTWWKPDAEIRWFINNEKEFGPYTKDLPNNIYTAEFNRDSLLRIKELIKRIEDPTTDSIDRTQATNTVRMNLKKFTASIRQEKPFLFHFKSKVYLAQKFVVHSGTPFLFQTKFDELNDFKKILKIGYSLLYVLVMTLGSMGIILMLFKLKNLPVGFLLFPALSLYLLLIHPFLGHVEFRYLVPTYPFMLVCTSYIIIFSLDKIRNRSIFSNN